MPAPAPPAPGRRALLPGHMEEHFPKRKLISLWCTSARRRSASPLEKGEWHPHLGAGCAGLLCGDTTLSWGHLGTKPVPWAGCSPVSTAPPPSPPAPRAELAATSEPEPLLQEVSSDAGVSLADFKDPLEMSRHNTYF